MREVREKWPDWFELTETGQKHYQFYLFTFLNPQLSSFSKPVPTVATDSCSWLTGVRPMWSSAVEVHLPQFLACCTF